MRTAPPGARVLILGARNQHECLVDEDDYAFLVQWRWTFVVASWKPGRNVYGRRCMRVDGFKRTILLHDVILEQRMGLPRPSGDYTADHKNGDTLDNRQGNLRWFTGAQQFHNQRARRQPAEAAA